MATIDNVFALGRRKEAVARVRIFAGTGKITVNKKPIEEFFKREADRIVINHPFSVTQLIGRFDVKANVAGGGTSGQAGAIKLGIARALVKADITLRPALKKAGLLTRDPRMKERKKYGQKRARKRFQYSKR